MKYTEKLALLRESNSLLRKLKHFPAGGNHRDKLKMLRERNVVLSKLGAFSTATTDTPATTDYAVGLAAPLLSSLEIDTDLIASNARTQIEQGIAGNAEITRIMTAKGWGKQKQKNTIKKLQSFTQAGDAARYLKTQIPQPLGEHTWDIFDEVRKVHDAVYAEAGAGIMPVVDHLISASPMTLNNAVNLANKSTFTNKATQRLKSIAKGIKGDYSKNTGRMMLDMSTFFRLSAFDGEPIQFDWRGSRQHYNNKDRTINVGDALSEGVLHHECAHAIEYDHPETLDMTKDFLRGRLAVSNGIRPLTTVTRETWSRKLTVKESRSRQGEMVIDDGAFTPYVTKVYGDGVDDTRATEVLTMGFQSLTNTKDLGLMAVNDPAHFKFVVGVIQHLQTKYAKKYNVEVAA